jgi:hypothetical protein
MERGRKKEGERERVMRRREGKRRMRWRVREERKSRVRERGEVEGGGRGDERDPEIFLSPTSLPI